jgi:DNA-binding Xre family transcriptional regulator
MLKLQLDAVFHQRGIHKPLHFLVKKGFTYHTAHRLLNNLVDSISYTHLEQLCLHLNCSLDDLFVWTRPDDVPVPDHHPLNKLVQQDNLGNITQNLLELPLDKLRQLQQIAEKLREE